ncbi:hypothetical protein XELAEV_18031078mg [Xenopus laevis]|uniref:Uncharacterized protein n=1 Tax=Xenopus laevis TaxID=8355 RepID=A0A974CMG4_XENLA|nr:hypothetical protein XELAEV_18031078mg [Xenopus laevis]
MGICLGICCCLVETIGDRDLTVNFPIINRKRAQKYTQCWHCSPIVFARCPSAFALPSELCLLLLQKIIRGFVCQKTTERL